MATPKKRGRPATGRGVPIQVRMTGDLLTALDRERERLVHERPGASISRADVIREIVGRALLTKAGR